MTGRRQVSPAENVVVQSHFGPGWMSTVTRVLDVKDDIIVLHCASEYPGPFGTQLRRAVGGLGTSAVVLDAIVVGYPALGLQRPATSDSRRLRIAEDGTLGDAESVYRREIHLDGGMQRGHRFR